jgi:hypothetical protein
LKLFLPSSDNSDGRQNPSYKNLSPESSDPLFHGVGLLGSQLPSEHDPGLHDEEDASDVLEPIFKISFGRNLQTKHD